MPPGRKRRQRRIRYEIARRRRRGELSAVRRGAYVLGLLDDDDVRQQHRRLIEATVPQLRAEGAISYASAAVLHDLPTWGADLRGGVHVTRPRTGGGGKRRSVVRLHASPLDDVDVTVIDGITVTSLERTIFDLARSLPFDRAVAAGDRALAMGMAVELLTEMVERRFRWRGSRQARRVAAFIDVRAESPGESVSRARCAELGLPAPRPQQPVLLPTGAWAYGDLGWEEFMTIGEFDGLVKYEKLLRPGEKSSDAVVKEKRREDLLRAFGVADRALDLGGSVELRPRIPAAAGRLRTRASTHRDHLMCTPPRTFYRQRHPDVRVPLTVKGCAVNPGPGAGYGEAGSAQWA